MKAKFIFFMLIIGLCANDHNLSSNDNCQSHGARLLRYEPKSLMQLTAEYFSKAVNHNLQNKDINSGFEAVNNNLGLQEQVHKSVAISFSPVALTLSEKMDPKEIKFLTWTMKAEKMACMYKDKPFLLPFPKILSLDTEIDGSKPYHRRSYLYKNDCTLFLDGLEKAIHLNQYDTCVGESSDSDKFYVWYADENKLYLTSLKDRSQKKLFDTPLIFSPSGMIEVAEKTLIAWDVETVHFIKHDSFGKSKSISYPKSFYEQANPFVSFDGQYSGIISPGHVFIFDNARLFEEPIAKISEPTYLATFLPEYEDCVFLLTHNCQGILYSFKMAKVISTVSFPFETAEYVSFAYPEKNALWCKTRNGLDILGLELPSASSVTLYAAFLKKMEIQKKKKEASEKLAAVINQLNLNS